MLIFKKRKNLLKDVLLRNLLNTFVLVYNKYCKFRSTRYEAAHGECKHSTEPTPKPKVKKKQPQGYNLEYFGLLWSRMDRKGAKEAVKSRKRHENAETSTWLRMRLGSSRRGRRDCTLKEGPQTLKTVPDA
jgi:hypothetical protein